MSVNEDIKSIQRRLDGITETTDTAVGSQELANGDEVVFTITTSSDSGAKVNASVDLSLYIGAALSGLQLPGGASILESQWQVIGPWSDWGSTNNINQKTRIYIRNISAGTNTVLIRTKSRVIVNSATPTPST